MKKIQMRKMVFISLFAASALLFGSVGAFAATGIEKITAYLNHDIKFKVDGKAWTPKDSDGNKLSPVVYEGSSYLPARAISEALGAEVKWDGDTQTIQITSGKGSSTSGIPYKDGAPAVNYSAQAKAVIMANQKAAENEDIEVYKKTLARSISSEENLAVYKKLFDTYDVKYNVISMEVISANSDEAVVEEVLETRKVSGPDFKDNRAKAKHYLKMEDGSFKIYKSEILNVEYLVDNSSVTAEVPAGSGIMKLAGTKDQMTEKMRQQAVQVIKLYGEALETGSPEKFNAYIDKFVSDKREHSPILNAKEYHKQQFAEFLNGKIAANSADTVAQYAKALKDVSLSDVEVNNVSEKNEFFQDFSFNFYPKDWQESSGVDVYFRFSAEQYDSENFILSDVYFL